VGCRARDEAGDGLRMVRMVVEEGEVAFDLAGGAFGRGAHVHPTPSCLAAAPKGLARAFHRPVTISPAELGERLVASCVRRFKGLLLGARGARVLAIGAQAATDALRRGALAVVATDAGSVAHSTEVQAAAGAGKAVAWMTKTELGILLGEESVAICAVCHDGIAAELKNLRAVADAGARAMGEGAGCSRRPEAR
jgi:predicted RNA-binding protein YlxR (DUF448 family)